MKTKENQSSQDLNLNEVFLEWSFPEFERQIRSKTWYLVFGLIVLVLLIYSIFTANLLFAAILVLASFVLVVQNFQKPLDLQVQITEKGIIIGDKYYSYTDLNKFWLVYDPPVKKLYLTFKGTLKPNLSLPLNDINPLKVRAILEEFIQEDLTRENEELNQVLARMFKI